jgi:hypothetical protein
VTENFRLSLEIDFGIDVGGIDGDMAEPRADRVDVNPGTKQVGSSRMPAMYPET